MKRRRHGRAPFARMPALIVLSGLVADRSYFGGGGTRQATPATLPAPSVAVMSASPGPTWKCRIWPGPIVLTSRTPESLIVSSSAKGKLPSSIVGGVQLSPALTW